MDSIESQAQAIADALAPSPKQPSARWRWGTVESVSEHGTMNVSVGGATVPGVRAAQHAMGARPGDRVRVMFCGTEAMVDAVRAASGLLTLPQVEAESINGMPAADIVAATDYVKSGIVRFEEVRSAPFTLAAWAASYVYADLPVIDGWTRRAVAQVWGSSGSVIAGSASLTGNRARAQALAVSAVSGATLSFYVMYVSNR